MNLQELTTESAVGNLPPNSLVAARTQLQFECSKITETIQAIRIRARDDSLRAQTTREPLDEKEALRRRERIRELQAKLMTAQGELGEVNRQIRATHTSRSRPVVDNPDHTQASTAIVAPAAAPAKKFKPAYRPPPRIVLEFFFQLARETLPEKEFGRLLRDAERLAAQAKATGLIQDIGKGTT